MGSRCNKKKSTFLPTGRSYFQLSIITWKFQLSTLFSFKHFGFWHPPHLHLRIFSALLWADIDIFWNHTFEASVTQQLKEILISCIYSSKRITFLHNTFTISPFQLMETGQTWTDTTTGAKGILFSVLLTDKYHTWESARWGGMRLEKPSAHWDYKPIDYIIC